MMLPSVYVVPLNVEMGVVAPCVVRVGSAHQRKSPVSRAFFIDERARQSDLQRSITINVACDSSVRLVRSTCRRDPQRHVCRWAQTRIARRKGPHHTTPSRIVLATFCHTASPQRMSNLQRSSEETAAARKLPNTRFFTRSRAHGRVKYQALLNSATARRFRRQAQASL